MCKYNLYNSKRQLINKLIKPLKSDLFIKLNSKLNKKHKNELKLICKKVGIKNIGNNSKSSIIKKILVPLTNIKKYKMTISISDIPNVSNKLDIENVYTNTHDLTEMPADIFQVASFSPVDNVATNLICHDRPASRYLAVFEAYEPVLADSRPALTHQFHNEGFFA